MHDMKSFRKAVRNEMSQLTAIMKRLEFSISRLRGRERLALRRKLAGLKRFRHYIALGLHHMNRQERPVSPTFIQKIQANLHFIRNGCRQLEAQLK